MEDYYKLSFLRDTEGGKEWEDIYIKIEDSFAQIIAPHPPNKSNGNI